MDAGLGYGGSTGEALPAHVTPCRLARSRAADASGSCAWCCAASRGLLRCTEHESDDAHPAGYEHAGGGNRERHHPARPLGERAERGDGIGFRGLAGQSAICHCQFQGMHSSRCAGIRFARRSVGGLREFEHQPTSAGRVLSKRACSQLRSASYRDQGSDVTRGAGFRPPRQPLGGRWYDCCGVRCGLAGWRADPNPDRRLVVTCRRSSQPCLRHSRRSMGGKL